MQESLRQYRKVEQMLSGLPSAKIPQSLLDKIIRKIERIEQEHRCSLENRDPPEVSDKVRKLMRTMFSLEDPEVKGSSLLGEAITLARFGQFEAAMQEFEKLFDNDRLRMDAAKNMLQYGLEYKSEREMGALIRKWKDDIRFSAEEHNYIVQYLHQLIQNERAENRGKTNRNDESPPDIPEGNIPDISALGLKLPKGPKAGESVRLPVYFQHGPRLNVIVSEDSPHIAEALQQGDLISEVTFFSPAPGFSGTLYVQRCRKIDFARKKGTSVNLAITRFQAG